MLPDLFSDLLSNTMRHMQVGGWVMIPLMIVSVFMVLLIAKKFIELREFTRGDTPFEEIVKTVGTDAYTAASWQKKIINEFLKKRTFEKNLDQSILDSLRIRQEDFIRRYIGMIAVLAGVAPLLGLLGTVSGMITTFMVIASFGTGNAKALASGISEALITTQTGLVIAVPGLFLANFLHRRSARLMAEMRRFCLDLLQHHEMIETGKGPGQGQ